VRMVLKIFYVQRYFMAMKFNPIQLKMILIHLD